MSVSFEGVKRGFEGFVSNVKQALESETAKKVGYVALAILAVCAVAACIVAAPLTAGLSLAMLGLAVLSIGAIGCAIILGRRNQQAL